MIAASDIARTAVELLDETWTGVRVIELEGPRRYSANDSAAGFGVALEHPVRTEAVPRSQWETLFRSQGMGNPMPRPAPRQLMEAERMSAIGRMLARYPMICATRSRRSMPTPSSERHDRCASARAELLLEIQEVVLAMTERIDSLLQFGSSGRTNPLVHECVSLVVEKAAAAVKLHPDGRNVSITVGKFLPTKAFIDARNLESAIFNLLLNACQAAIRSTHVPEVKVDLTEAHERIYITILDNGPGYTCLCLEDVIRSVRNRRKTQRNRPGAHSGSSNS
jgi:signal transduction histidine kinase